MSFMRGVTMHKRGVECNPSYQIRVNFSLADVLQILEATFGPIE
jgi:hypothetical protein